MLTMVWPKLAPVLIERHRSSSLRLFLRIKNQLIGARYRLTNIIHCCILHAKRHLRIDVFIYYSGMLNNKA